MKLKKVVFILITLIVILLVAALFISNKYDVERSIVINKPKAEVFDYLRYIKNYEKFVKWKDIHSGRRNVYKGIDGEIGYIFFWTNVNGVKTTGEQEIMNIDEGHRLDFELRFLEPFEAIIPSSMITETIDANNTKVIWLTNGELSYPLNIVLMFYYYGEKIGDDLSIGLNNLKVILEDSNE
ncbi:SRPBCC family protein [Pseudocolwellia sp. HL-MZ7]|uniref:SRPBCC family protein n=1 Tax=Pseudocolwellia sp. HL-MZ7 TaxID=3400627 RepID=UPI003CEDF020